MEDYPRREPRPLDRLHQRSCRPTGSGLLQPGPGLDRLWEARKPRLSRDSSRRLRLL